MSSVSNKLDSKDWDKIIKEINASIASGEFYTDDEMTDEEYNDVERRCTEIHHKIDDLITEAYN